MSYLVCFTQAARSLCEVDYKGLAAQGRIQDLVRGGAKLTQGRRMRRLSLRTRMYGPTLLFLMPPIFPSEEQKKKRSQPTPTPLWTIT